MTSRKKQEDKNPIAVEFGRLGGQATAKKKDKNFYREIQKLGIEARKQNKLNKLEGVTVTEENTNINNNTDIPNVKLI